MKFVQEYTHVATKRYNGIKSLPVANYNSAIARALDWLGDRYLLAKPINAQPSRGMRAAARVYERAATTEIR